MLDALFRPRAVAVVGASPRPLSIGHMVVRNLAAHRFAGPIYPVHPRAREVLGYRAYPSVAELPDGVDLVNIAVPREQVLEVIEACGARGVRVAIVHTAGFGEADAAGQELERQVLAAARRHGMRIFGPNSQGVESSDPAVSVYANFTFVPLTPGSISIVTQSGGVGELLKLHLYRAGLGHRLYCSYGNESDVSLAEILTYYGQDPGTRAILVQVETLSDPQALLEAAAAVTPRLPVLALKSGRSPEGARAAASHTGRLADQRALASAVFRKAGVLEVGDTRELLAGAMACASQPPPAGPRLGVITNTGGPGVQVVDEAVDQGLVLARWSPAGEARLARALPPGASRGNPVDVLATAGPEAYAAALQTLLDEPGTDMVLVFLVTAPFADHEAIARCIAETARGGDKPVAVVVETLEPDAPLVGRLRAAGLPVYELAEDGARGLAALYRQAGLRARPQERPPELEVDGDAARAILARGERGDGLLAQPDAFALLRACGIAAPRVARVAGEGDLEPAAREVGFPCVLKLDAAGVVHKAAAGGVVTDIRSEAELREAHAALVGAHGPGTPPCALVAQVPAGLELLVGASRSAEGVPLVAFGLGGALAEVLGDVAFALAPPSRAEARELMQLSRARAALREPKPEAPATAAGQAVEEILVRVGRLVCDLPAIAELDLNPVIVAPDRSAAVAVDVRVRLREAGPGSFNKLKASPLDLEG